MNLIIFIFFSPIILYLSIAVIYHIFLAAIYFLIKEKPGNQNFPKLKYQILIPAHNEEVLIGRLLESFKQIKYEKALYEVTVIADNCTDRTAEIVSEKGIQVISRWNPAKKGKGFAIQWALEKVDLTPYDVVVIIDADNLIDPDFFSGLNDVFSRGFDAVQCNNTLANPDRNAFTRIMYLARTIDNELYHHAKYKLGLSSFLMGNGMCFSTKILNTYKWTTTTLAEDYEYYSKLVSHDILIGFSRKSKVFHQESIGVRHATRQRLRWSSGRFHVARTQGFDLLKKGLKEKKYKKIDASFPLILPNLSLMINMTISVLSALIFIHLFIPVSNMILWVLFLLFCEAGYCMSGIILTKMSLAKFIYAVCYAPVFLLWKGYIDIKGLLNKKIQEWGTSKRL